MFEWMAGFLVAVAIVAVQCVLVLALALPFTRLYNQDGRQRLFGHFDTSPPRGIRAYRGCRYGTLPPPRDRSTR